MCLSKGGNRTRLLDGTNWIGALCTLPAVEGRSLGVCACCWAWVCARRVEGGLSKRVEAFCNLITRSLRREGEQPSDKWDKGAHDRGTINLHRPCLYDCCAGGEGVSMWDLWALQCRNTSHCCEGASSLAERRRARCMMKEGCTTDFFTVDTPAAYIALTDTRT